MKAYSVDFREKIVSAIEKGDSSVRKVAQRFGVSKNEVYISQCLVPQLWKGAVVIMDNLPAHKVKAIAPLIEAVGARILYLSPYSPEFNPIEHWWSQLKAFLRQFSPRTSKKVDTLIKIAMDLMNPKHLRNWFAHCCYCPS